jgi:hypothetical protein
MVAAPLVLLGHLGSLCAVARDFPVGGLARPQLHGHGRQLALGLVAVKPLVVQGVARRASVRSPSLTSDFSSQIFRATYGMGPTTGQGGWFGFPGRRFRFPVRSRGPRGIINECTRGRLMRCCDLRAYRFRREQENASGNAREALNVVSVLLAPPLTPSLPVE